MSAMTSTAISSFIARENSNCVPLKITKICVRVYRISCFETLKVNMFSWVIYFICGHFLSLNTRKNYIKYFNLVDVGICFTLLDLEILLKDNESSDFQHCDRILHTFIYWYVLDWYALQMFKQEYMYFILRKSIVSLTPSNQLFSVGRCFCDLLSNYRIYVCKPQRHAEISQISLKLWKIFSSIINLLALSRWWWSSSLKVKLRLIRAY